MNTSLNQVDFIEIKPDFMGYMFSKLFAWQLHFLLLSIPLWIFGVSPLYGYLGMVTAISGGKIWDSYASYKRTRYKIDFTEKMFYFYSLDKQVDSIEFDNVSNVSIVVYSDNFVNLYLYRNKSYSMFYNRDNIIFKKVNGSCFTFNFSVLRYGSDACIAGISLDLANLVASQLKPGGVS
jgi:hypothetical protein